MYLIFDRMCHTCKCSGIAPIGIGIYHTSNSTAPISERDTDIEVPALTTCASNVEEITSERAGRIYQCIYRAIWKHQGSCEECDRLAKMDMMCIEQLSLWKSLQWWGEQAEAKEGIV